MSFNQTDYENCKKKRVYLKKSQAQQEAARINRQMQKQGKLSKLRPYKCKVCGRFHLTSQSKEHQKIIQRHYLELDYGRRMERINELKRQRGLK